VPTRWCTGDVERAATTRSDAAAVQHPPGRDLYLDLVRLVAISVVVLLHWLSVMPDLRGGMVVDVNVVDVTTGLWPFSWVGDVMALFFFVGGYANAGSLDRAREAGRTTLQYVAHRYGRLLRPTFAFLGVWLGIDLLARVVGRADLSPLAHVSTGNTIPFGPLWFIGVYLVLIALSPLTLAAHRRWGVAVPAAMVAAVAVADALTFATGVSAFLALNLVLVWSVPHQLGYFYADGSLRRLPVRGRAAMALGGLLAVAILTSTPAYPRSLVTLPWQVSIMGAPMLTQVASAFWMVGLALLLQPLGERLLGRPAVRAVVERCTPLAMPVFLWHMTAYLVAASVLVWLGAGFVYGIRTDPVWWWTRPVLMAWSALALAAILLARRSLSRARRRGRSPTVSA
jgi:fucose 4-O-acetylase-like acetyltransferase